MQCTECLCPPKFICWSRQPHPGDSRPAFPSAHRLTPADGCSGSPPSGRFPTCRAPQVPPPPRPTRQRGCSRGCPLLPPCHCLPAAHGHLPAGSHGTPGCRLHAWPALVLAQLACSPLWGTLCLPDTSTRQVPSAPGPTRCLFRPRRDPSTACAFICHFAVCLVAQEPVPGLPAPTCPRGGAERVASR